MMPLNPDASLMGVNQYIFDGREKVFQRRRISHPAGLLIALSAMK